MSKIHTLIFPDIHGRTFWKDALNKFPISEYPDLQIIFLGDYLDPYTGYEPISKENAFDNFNEILALDDPRITLLIGNHDWHYFVNLDTCRIDFSREKQIEKLFKDNINRFRLHKIIEINCVKYLFTHAGITQKWLDNVASMARSEYEKWNPGDPSENNYVDPATDKDYQWLSNMCDINETHNFELLEECLQNYDNNFYTAPISMVSRERGGWFPYGSLIWADVHEHIYNDDLYGFYQVFGHTITYPNDQYSYAISPDNHTWAMIDASQAFTIDDENNLKIVE